MSSELTDKVLVFIPTFNDLEKLAELTRAVCALGHQFTPLVVDDGSSPPVSLSTLDKRALLTRLPGNLGLGVATHVAFDHALRHGYNLVVRTDADGQHPIDAIPDLLISLRSQEGISLIVATRTNRHEGHGLRSFVAKFVRGYFSTIARWMSAGGAPSDVNSGFFAANRSAMEVLNETPLEQFPEPQMYILAPRRGLKVGEISLEQLSREHGSSTITVGRALMLLYRFNIFVLAELLQKSSNR